MFNSLEQEIDKASLKAGQVFYTHFRTNTLDKSINPSSYRLNSKLGSLFGNQSRRRKTKIKTQPSEALHG